MRRNRASALKPKTVIASIVICSAICLAGIGYVWAKSQVWRLSGEIKALELRLDEVKRDNDVLQRTYAAMCAPSKLDARVRELNLGLSAPMPSQIVRMQSEFTPLVRAKPDPLAYAATNTD